MKETDDVIKTLIASTKPATDEDVMQNIPGHMTTITHPERLLQDTDLNRLRALVYREVEDSRQSQYVALVVIYYVAVLMVARYRDILENETDDLSTKRSHSKSMCFLTLLVSNTIISLQFPYPLTAKSWKKTL